MPVADPHCHTLSSDGMVTPSELVDAAVGAGIDLIAVTDHDTMDAVQEVQRRGEAAGLAVVPGQEITTGRPALTHMMGWFLQRPVKPGMTLEDTVAAIHDQGGLAIVPHPFMPTYFGSIQPGMLRRLIERNPVDGIELIFTAPIGARRKRMLESFYAQHKARLGAAVGGSDCHFGTYDIGRVVTRYDGDFRAAVESRSTQPERSSKAGHVPVSVALAQQWRSLVQLPLRRLRGQL
ncbi:MAG: PHP domain-containing protein [Candidatus Dormibacterales bacterium]